MGKYSKGREAACFRLAAISHAIALAALQGCGGSNEEVAADTLSVAESATDSMRIEEAQRARWRAVDGTV